MPQVDVNWTAVLVAAVVNMVVGFVWYSKALFGKDWSKLTGRKLEDMSKNAGPTYLLTILGALIQAYILFHFVVFAGAKTAAEGAVTGLWLWVGFVAVTQGVYTLFANSRKKLWAINTGYFLVVLLINGALLATWK